jgi:hypothetical protein
VPGSVLTRLYCGIESPLVHISRIHVRVPQIEASSIDLIPNVVVTERGRGDVVRAAPVDQLLLAKRLDELGALFIMSLKS